MNNTAVKQIPMTYNDYFTSGHYANSAFPCNATLTFSYVLSQDSINSIVSIQSNGISILENPTILTTTQSVMSAFSTINSTQTVPNGIVSCVRNDISGKILSTIVALNGSSQATPANILAYFNVNILDANHSYILTVNGTPTPNVITMTNVLTTSITLTFTTNVMFGGIRKFVDKLPQMGQAGANDLGNFLAVAVPDKLKYPGCDYYEIGFVEYRHKFHSDLKPTKVRGYVQLNNPADLATFDAMGNLVHMPNVQYCGPIIVAQANVPVRVKYMNLLPTGAGGELFIPLDTTIMGAGYGPDMMNMYTQNRGVVHLHGGVTPWISDGTAQQWITPANEKTVYPKGVSVINVPDMEPPGPGAQTFYYTNQQSARLMWFHDHTYGTTRLNVYVGELSLFILHDEYEADLINRGIIPSDADTMPLVIQDKTFIPPLEQLNFQDPTWERGKAIGFPWGSEGDLWYPHVLVPNQNPSEPTGAYDLGRWDYGPWFWPPFTDMKYPPLIDNSDPANLREYPAIPNPTITPEAFMDTTMVNGCVYPYVEVQQKAYRFRILNGCNDRTINLQLHRAISNTPSTIIKDDGTIGELHLDSGDINMVDAQYNPDYPSQWPTDGRDGGVPDPSKIGPKMIQIGNEGGFLPAPFVHNNLPVNYDYDRKSIVLLNVTTHNLLMGPAERADIIIDFATCQAGDIIILYNDNPAPIPGFDSRLDYYSGNVDQVSSGGAPSTVQGFGSNTRTIMQFRVVAGVDTPVPWDSVKLDTLTTELGNVFVKTQEPPLVPQGYYAPLYADKLGDASLYVDNFCRIQDASLTFKNINSSAAAKTTVSNGAVSQIVLIDSGADYNPETTSVIIDAPINGTQATAQAVYSPGAITDITLTNGGDNYHLTNVTITGRRNGADVIVNVSATIDPVTGAIININLPGPGVLFDRTPNVAIEAPVDPAGVQAYATANLVNNAIVSYNIISSGTGYGAYVRIDGFGFDAVLTPVLANGKVVGLRIDNHGYGYWTTPTVVINPPPTGIQAKAIITVDRGQISSVTMVHMGSGYYTTPGATVTATSDKYAIVNASMTLGQIDTVTITLGGTGYTSSPTITVTPPDIPSGRQAVLTSVITNGKLVNIIIADPGAGYFAPPIITITDPHLINSTAICTIIQPGTITSLTLVDGGAGYSSAPVVNIMGSTLVANPATATANVALKNSINNIMIVNGGSGYNTPPKINIIDRTGMFYTIDFQPKCIQELFTSDYGRMNATFGVEIPRATATTQTTIPLGYADPPTELMNMCTHALGPVRGDGTQIWQVTHNGVDTHFVHFHLVNVQLINRIGWDGMITPPYPNEYGWKETVRMNPLETAIVIMRPVAPGLPFGIPDSVRYYSTTMAPGATSTTDFINIDPLTGAAVTTVNSLFNYGWEYMWHCHILGHEENDMMRAVAVKVDNIVPDPLYISGQQVSNTQVTLSWSNPQIIEILSYNVKGIVGINVERAINGIYTTIATIPSNSTMYVDTTIVRGMTYNYRVTAFNSAGPSPSNIITLMIR